MSEASKPTNELPDAEVCLSLATIEKIQKQMRQAGMPSTVVMITGVSMRFLSLACEDRPRQIQREIGTYFFERVKEYEKENI
jgi:hypothetical protein